jgi:MoaA/NifB/PqqE/SkfB family radical SAM enzyme
MNALSLKNYETTFCLKSANLELTRDCNLRCTYCAASQPNYRRITLGTDEIELAIDGLREMRANSVALNGHGETSTVKDWHHTIARIARWGARINLTSNFARAFTDEETDALLSLTSIVISLDTDDAELLAKTRRGLHLETVLDNIERLQGRASERGVKCPKLIASCVVHTHNVMHLDRFVRFCLRQGIRGFGFCNLVEYPEIPGALHVGHVAGLPREELAAAKRKIAEAKGVAFSRGADCEIQSGLLDAIDQALGYTEAPPAARFGSQKRYFRRPEAGQTRRCLDPWFFAMIQADASVLPCCYRPAIGSLKQQPLRAILNGDAAIALRGQLMTGDLAGHCMTCPARPVVSIREFEALVAAKVPGNWAVGRIMRAALAAMQSTRKLGTAARGSWEWLARPPRLGHPLNRV